MRILPAVLIALLAVSCIPSSDRNRDDFFQLNNLTVQGKVMDAEDHSVISGIMIDITAYETKDPDKTNPVLFQVLRSNFDGSYSFIQMNSEEKPLNSSCFYEFKVYDEKGEFKTIVRDLYISSSNPSYSANSKSYRVMDNDFYLSR